MRSTTFYWTIKVDKHDDKYTGIDNSTIIEFYIKFTTHHLSPYTTSTPLHDKLTTIVKFHIKSTAYYLTLHTTCTSLPPEEISVRYD